MAMIGVDVSWGTIQGFLIPGIFWGEALREGGGVRGLGVQTHI